MCGSQGFRAVVTYLLVGKAAERPPPFYGEIYDTKGMARIRAVRRGAPVGVRRSCTCQMKLGSLSQCDVHHGVRGLEVVFRKLHHGVGIIELAAENVKICTVCAVRKVARDERRLDELYH